MAFLTASATCLLGILICSSFLGAEAKNCDRGWLHNQGNCYQYFHDKLTWAEAELECQNFRSGAHLASIHTEAETELLAGHIANFQEDDVDFWIGLHDARQNGKWRWSDRSPYDYRAWMRNEPNNVNNSEYCVELRYISYWYQWNDESCKKRNAYICKYEL